MDEQMRLKASQKAFGDYKIIRIQGTLALTLIGFKKLRRIFC